MLGWFKKSKWALVKSFREDFPKYPYYVYHIHLFESETGKRKAEYTCDGAPYNINKTGGWLKRQDIYQMRVYRWLKGRPDPDIPRFSEVGEEDLANALKGTI